MDFGVPTSRRNVLTADHIVVKLMLELFNCKHVHLDASSSLPRSPIYLILRLGTAWGPRVINSYDLGLRLNFTLFWVFARHPCEDSWVQVYYRLCWVSTGVEQDLGCNLAIVFKATFLLIMSHFPIGVFFVTLKWIIRQNWNVTLFETKVFRSPLLSWDEVSDSLTFSKLNDCNVCI